ncbi:MAG: 1-acyl-sn-glycerol-3-phosphate acyltransferase [Myxococcales bacterium]|nr:MAG: 1-acyl-sn-glycerol-3-phosphate acyltransferase [Myxococcales bacterium]
MNSATSTPSKAFVPHDSWITRGVSVLLWSINLAWMIPSMLLLTAIWKAVPVRRTEWLTRLQCRVQIALTGCKWRAIVHPDVDPKRSYLFLQNHTNHFDYAVMANATPHPLQGVELEKHFKYPVYGWFMKARGTIPIKQGSATANKDLGDRMKRELERGMSILLFPEGTRTLDGRLGPLRRGAFHMALQLGVPIVPVTVTGMYETMHKGSLLIRPGYTVTVHVDKPIETTALNKRDVPALMEQVRTVMSNHIDAYWQKQSEQQALETAQSGVQSG